MTEEADNHVATHEGEEDEDNGDGSHCNAYRAMPYLVLSSLMSHAQYIESMYIRCANETGKK